RGLGPGPGPHGALPGPLQQIREATARLAGDGQEVVDELLCPGVDVIRAEGPVLHRELVTRLRGLPAVAARRHTVLRLETGKLAPDLGLLSELAGVFRTTLVEFLAPILIPTDETMALERASRERLAAELVAHDRALLEEWRRAAARDSVRR